MKHKEGFCLMRYATKPDEPVQEEEFIWNSRDGVVPYIIYSRHDKDRRMNHADVSQDTLLPEYKPKPGERIFVEATRELLEPVARERVEMNWEPLRRSGQFKTQQDAIEMYLREWVQPNRPMLVTVQADGTYTYG